MSAILTYVLVAMWHTIYNNLNVFVVVTSIYLNYIKSLECGYVFI